MDFNYDLSLIGLLAALVLAIGAVIGWLRCRNDLHDLRKHVAEQQSANDAMRSRIAAVSGWQPGGTLPADWDERVREALTPEAPVAMDAPAVQDELCFAIEALNTAGPPVFLAERTDLSIFEFRHLRLLDALSGLAEDPSAVEHMFKNGEFDYVFSATHRANVYFPSQIPGMALTLVASILAERLWRRGIVVDKPAPLSFVAPGSVEIENGVVDEVHDSATIRRTVALYGAVGTDDTGNRRLVIDLLAPGWRSDASSQLPKVLVWDRSWLGA